MIACVNVEQMTKILREEHFQNKERDPRTCNLKKDKVFKIKSVEYVQRNDVKNAFAANYSYLKHTSQYTVFITFSCFFNCFSTHTVTHSHTDMSVRYSVRHFKVNTACPNQGYGSEGSAV